MRETCGRFNQACFGTVMNGSIMGADKVYTYWSVGVNESVPELDVVYQLDEYLPEHSRVGIVKESFIAGVSGGYTSGSILSGVSSVFDVVDAALGLEAYLKDLTEQEDIPSRFRLELADKISLFSDSLGAVVNRTEPEAEVEADEQQDPEPAAVEAAEEEEGNPQ